MTQQHENKIQRWLSLHFGTAREEEAARISAQLRTLEETISRQEEQQDARTAEQEAMLCRLEQTLDQSGLMVFAFRREDGAQLLGHRAGQSWAQALTEEAELLQDVLAQAALQESVCMANRWITVREYPADAVVYYTLQDVTELMSLRQARASAGLRDPATGLYTREALMEKARQLLAGDEPQKTVCALHIRIRRWEDIPAGTGRSPEHFLRACGQSLEREGLILARGGDDVLQGLLFGCEETDLPDLLKTLLADMEEKTILLEPGQIRCHDVIMGAALASGDCRQAEALFQRARLGAWKARQGIAWYDSITGGPFLEALEDFRELVDGEQVGFLFQPIVRRSNAKVEGYELVMESCHPRLTSMSRILELADFLGQRQALERLLWFQGLARVAEQMSGGRMFYNQKVWIPSLAGTCLSDGDHQRLVETYFDYFQYLVLDLKAPGQETHAALKRRRAARLGMATAVSAEDLTRDDALALCSLQPEWVRIGRSLVQGIAQDRARQKLYGTLHSFASARGCRLLAEGIENGEDLRTVIRLGADCLQGDYLGKAETVPADIPEKRIEQIGQAQYGKRG